MASITFSQSYGLGLDIFSGVRTFKSNALGEPYVEVDNFFAGRLVWNGTFDNSGNSLAGTISSILMPTVGVTITGMHVDYVKLDHATNNANPQDWEIGRILFGRRDTFHGSSGNDAIDLWDGDDVLKGFGGDDSLYGGRGADVLIGGKGNDLLLGGYRNVPDEKNRLEGGAGDDGLFGGNGDDDIYGGAGNDYLNGDNGDTPGGNDLMVGGKGKDTLVGGGGNDIMRGGAGEDTFEFSWRDGGVNRIRDFQLGTDVLKFHSTLWGGGFDKHWALDHASAGSGHVVFRFDNGMAIHLDTVTDLTALADDILIVL